MSEKKAILVIGAGDATGGAIAVAMLAHHRKAIAPPDDLDGELVFDLREIAVEFTAKVDQQPIVGEFEGRFHNVLGTGRGGQRADAQGGLLLDYVRIC